VKIAVWIYFLYVIIAYNISQKFNCFISSQRCHYQLSEAVIHFSVPCKRSVTWCSTCTGVNWAWSLQQNTTEQWCIEKYERGARRCTFPMYIFKRVYGVCPL